MDIMLDYMPVSCVVQKAMIGYKPICINPLISMYIKTKYIDSLPIKIQKARKHNDIYSVIDFELS